MLRTDIGNVGKRHVSAGLAEAGGQQTAAAAAAFAMESDEHGRTILTVDGSSMGNLLAMQAFIGAVYTGRLQLCGMPPTLAFEVYQV